MKKIFNDTLLKSIPVIFFIIIALKITYTYYDLKDKEYEFAKKEAEVLNSYVLSNKVYYRGLFTNGTLELNGNTLQALPAFSSNIISNNFSNDNPLGITLKTVSDRARNSDNSANKDELKAIEFFKNNKNETEYFSDGNSDYYQYGSVLRIDKTCLNCHGKREDAPKFIRETYEDAYDYKIGEIRGIISIKIPIKNLKSYFFNNFIKSVFYDLILFIFLFLGIFYLIKKSKKLNGILRFKVKEKTKELKKSLLFERLTLLPNRLKLIEDINLNIASEFSHLSLINIDRFKDINDLYGYEAGDEILKQVALKAKEICESSCCVYKLPNDEYALFTTLNITREEFLVRIQAMINKIQESKFEVDGNLVFITLSCGIACNEESLMIKANAALQIAKKTSTSIVPYDSSQDTKEKIALNIDGILLLKNAIKENRITPYFQPIYNIKTKNIEKYEALARIIAKDGEVILPIAFLEIATKSKLYHEITKAMIKKSFEYFKDKDYEFSINLSIHDIQNKKTFQFIIDSLKEFEKSNKVVFEILEGDKIEDYKELKYFIKEVKKYGSKIAIDDFGSGYSNFSHIFELNADYLKIDSSLVKYITTDENSKIIVKTIINFAANLGLKTIAEYVEDKESMDLLEELGIDYIQGYYIGEPGPELRDNDYCCTI